MREVSFFGADLEVERVFFLDCARGFKEERGLSVAVYLFLGLLELFGRLCFVAGLEVFSFGFSLTNCFSFALLLCRRFLLLSAVSFFLFSLRSRFLVTFGVDARRVLFFASVAVRLPGLT